MLVFLKRVIVEVLRSSGRPELVEIATWVEDAEAATVRLIGKVIRSTLATGKPVSAADTQEILNIKGRASSGAAPTETHSTHPYLDEYLNIIETIAELGSLRPYLLLQGFIHTGDCSSLWVFEMDKAPRTAIMTSMTTGNATISLGRTTSHFDIFLLSPMDTAKITQLNEELETNPTITLATLLPKPRVTAVTQVTAVLERAVEIELTTDVIVTEKIRVGTKDVSHEVNKYQMVPIDMTTWGGILAMDQCLPQALAARGGPLAKLKSIGKQ